MAGVTQHDAYDNIPEDAFGEECSPNAKLWQVYMNEAQILDNAMTKELTENADVLLVFSGLFSAVVAGFVAMTSQSLQMDYVPVTAALMFEMVQLQRAALNGSDGASVQPSSWTPTASFSPSLTDVCVNGLWFTSLTVSLIAALMAVLAKQWVSYYVSKPPGSGTALDHVRIRQFRYTNFQKWSIPVIIGVLPFLLHIGLVMFLVGLVVFLFAFVSSLAITIATLTILTFLAYAATVILSTIDPSCPYRTPLSSILYSVLHQFFPNNSPSESTLYAVEQRTIENQIDSLDGDAILWLLRTSSNATVRALVIEAMGSVPPKSVSALKRVLNSERTVWEQHHRLLKESLMPINYFHQPRAGQENRVNRLLQVQRRLATPPILASEAPLTSRLVPSGFYQNDYNFLSTLVISLLEMHGGIVDHPLNWPSPAKMISRVIMDECQLPQYTWQDFFDRVDLASMCTLHAEHSPDSESFCASYLWSHYMWCNSNDGLPRSTDFRIERTGVFTFPEILPSIQARIDTTILAQFPASDTTILVQFPASDVHTRVITSVLDHLLSSDPKTRLAEEVSTCDTCSTLFTDALRNMRAILSKRSLSLEDSTAFKDVIHRILSSDLFADRADHHKNDSLWRIRERTLFTLGFMRPNSNQPGRGPLPHLHRWPISEDVINSLIRLGLHPNSVDCMSNSLKLSSLVVSRIISEHWCISDVDTTYSTFLEVDAFAFLGATKFLFSNNISIVAAYVQGLLRAKDNMTFVGPYAEYLYHSPNLYTALLIVTGQFGSVQATRDVVTSLLTRIIKLCPLGPEEAQARWKTALASLEAFSNMIDPIEYEFFDFDSERMIVYTPAQIADIKLHVKCYRDFLAGHIERLQSNSLELIDAVDVPFHVAYQKRRRLDPSGTKNSSHEMD